MPPNQRRMNAASVSPQGEPGQHYQDQREMYLNFECKEDHLTQDSVEDAAQSTLTITPSGDITEQAAERTPNWFSTIGWWTVLSAVALVGGVVSLVVRRRLGTTSNP